MAVRKRTSLDSNGARSSVLPQAFKCTARQVTEALIAKLSSAKKNPNLVPSNLPLCSTAIRASPAGTLGPGWHLLLACRDVKESIKEGPKPM